MPNKNMSFYIESPTDKLVTINGTNPFPSPTCCGAGFAGGTSGGITYTAWCEANPSGPQDLCVSVPTTVGTWSATFKRANNSTYTLSSNDFILDFAGYHPKPRPI